MSSEHELQIQIKTGADVSGLMAAEKGLQGVTGANKAAARSANELGENFERGAAAGRVLGEVAQGNVMAFGQLGAALKTIGVLIKTNLVGALVTLGAVAANILIPLIKGFRAAKEKIDETSGAFKEAEIAAKRLSEVKFKALETELAKLNSEAQRLLSIFKEVSQLEGERDEAVATAEIAKIQADPKLSESDKATRIAAVRSRTTGAKRKREDAVRAKELETIQKQLASTDEAAAEAVTKRDATRQVVETFKKAGRDRGVRIDSLQGELTGLEEEQRVDVATGGVETPDAQRRGARMQAIRSELETLRGRQADATSPATIDALKKQEAILAKEESAAEKLLEAAEALRNAVAEFTQRESATAPLRAQIRKAEDQTTAVEAAKAQPAPQSRPVVDSGRLNRLREVAQQAHDRGDFRAQDAAVAEIRQITSSIGTQGHEVVRAVKAVGHAVQENNQKIIKSHELLRNQIKNAR